MNQVFSQIHVRLAYLFFEITVCARVVVTVDDTIRVIVYMSVE
jgi:hypothetical protein